MVTVSKTKKSKYQINIGWGLVLYATHRNDVTETERRYGAGKVSIKRIKN